MFDVSPVLMAYSVADFRVRDGVAIGDMLGHCDQLFMDDIYQFNYEAMPVPLYETDTLRVHACLTFMTAESDICEILIFSDFGSDQLQFLPLVPLAAEKKYRLIASTTTNLDIKLASLAAPIALATASAR